MYIVKVLKRKDASSVIVAIVLAMIFFSLLPNLTNELADFLSGIDGGLYSGNNFPGATWQNRYLQPLVAAFLQLVVLEIGIRLAVFIRSMLVRRVK